MTQPRVALLGSYRVEGTDDRHILLRRAHRDRLLAYLVLRGPIVARAALQRAFWPDRGPKQQIARVRSEISKARALLVEAGADPSCIKCQHGTVRLTGVETDLEVFIADYNVLLLESHDLTEVNDRLRSMRRAYAEDGLLPLLEEPWVVRERDRYAEMMADAEARARKLSRELTPAGADAILPSWATLIDEVLEQAGGDPSGRHEAHGEEPYGEMALRREARYLLGMARVLEPQLIGPSRDFAMSALDGHRERLEAALEWAFDRGHRPVAQGLCAALWLWWHDRAHSSQHAFKPSQARAHIERALSMHGTFDETPDVAACIHGAGMLAMLDGDHAIAERRLDRARRAWAVVGDDARLARTVGAMTMLAYRTGDLDRARTLSAEAIGMTRELGDYAMRTVFEYEAALIAEKANDPVEASRHARASLECAEMQEDEGRVARAHSLLGWLEQVQGRHLEALRHHRTSLMHYERMGDVRGAANAMRNLGVVGHARHESGEGEVWLRSADELYRGSEDLSRGIGDMFGVGESLRMRAAVLADRGALPEAVEMATLARDMLEAAGHSSQAAAAASQLEEWSGTL